MATRDTEQMAKYTNWVYTYICTSRVWTPITVPRWSIIRSWPEWIKFPISSITWKPTENYEFLPSEHLTLSYNYSE